MLICHSIYLSIYLTIYLTIYLSIYVCIYQSLYTQCIYYSSIYLLIVIFILQALCIRRSSSQCALAKKYIFLIVIMVCESKANLTIIRIPKTSVRFFLIDKLDTENLSKCLTFGTYKTFKTFETFQHKRAFLHNWLSYWSTIWLLSITNSNW